VAAFPGPRGSLLPHRSPRIELRSDWTNGQHVRLRARKPWFYLRLGREPA